MNHVFKATHCRFWSSLVLTILYVVIALAPLAPLALKSDRINHAVTGECSGNCEIDGCPLESRINCTCCCWQKKRASEKKPVKVAGGCCDIKVTEPSPEPKSGCCAVGPTTPPERKQVSSCCATGSPVDSGLSEADAGAVDDQDREPSYKNNPPCGNGNSIAFSGAVKVEIVPYSFAVVMPASTVGMLFETSPLKLSSRFTSPPEPPPKTV